LLRIYTWHLYQLYARNQVCNSLIILFIFRFTTFLFSAFIRMYVPTVHMTGSASCTFPEFTFILSTNFVDYTFKLSIRLHVCVKYSQLEIWMNAAFQLALWFPNSLLSIRTFTTYDLYHREMYSLAPRSWQQSATLHHKSSVIPFQRRQSYVAQTTLYASYFCRMIFVWIELAISLFTSFLSGYDSLQWPQALHLLIRSINDASRIYCKLNYTTVLSYFVLAIHFSLLWVNQRRGKSSLLKKKPTCSNLCVSTGAHLQCKEIPHEVRRWW